MALSYFIEELMSEWASDEARTYHRLLSQMPPQDIPWKRPELAVLREDIRMIVKDVMGDYRDAFLTVMSDGGFPISAVVTP
ncbi:hypothetical protein [uncultured Roseobacter sp.]|uniref:hypothetical protein n=1 Tax=uncultured Roseobacter sp. TaxID=114847 RepID=UPI002613FABE|nr:hypothetical protein [uncultured Roseobacter sp.]